MEIETLIRRSGEEGYDVCCLVEDNGRSKTKKYLDNLRTKKNNEYKKIMRLLQLVSKKGYLQNDEKCKPVKGEVHEFKSYQERILWCYHPEKRCVVICLCAETKKKDELSDAVVTRALRLAQSIKKNLRSRL